MNQTITLTPEELDFLAYMIDAKSEELVDDIEKENIIDALADKLYMAKQAQILACPHQFNIHSGVTRYKRCVKCGFIKKEE